MNFKKLALAAALLGASVGANASWEYAQNENSGVNGELILTVWNVDLERAISVDLGVRASEFTTGRADGQSFSLNAADVAWLGTGNIRWNVVGANASFDEFPASYGYYFTANEGEVATGGQGFTEFGAQFQQFATYATQVPGLNSHYTGTANAAENLTVRSEGFLYAGRGAVWGDNAGNVSTFFGLYSSTTADETLAAWTGSFTGLTFEEIGNGAGATVILDDNYWALDLASNSLNYVAAPVPVPAAAWLLGSALLGLAGAVRRRKIA